MPETGTDKGPECIFSALRNENALIYVRNASSLHSAQGHSSEASPLVSEQQEGSQWGAHALNTHTTLRCGNGAALVPQLPRVQGSVNECATASATSAKRARVHACLNTCCSRCLYIHVFTHMHG